MWVIIMCVIDLCDNWMGGELISFTQSSFILIMQLTIFFLFDTQDGYSYLQKLITPLTEKGQRKTLKDLLVEFSTPVRTAGNTLFSFSLIFTSQLISILQASFLLRPAMHRLITNTHTHTPEASSIFLLRN